MYRPRIIPVLLLGKNGLVKSTSFSNYKYIGDPLNAVQIFNDFHADELIFLDIFATRQNRTIPLDLIKNVGEEAHMPFAVGGGIKTIKDIRAIINAGAERVVINTAAGLNPGFINEAAINFGSSAIAVSIDVKKDFWGKEKVWIKNGSKSLPYSPVAFAQLMERNGCGEIIIHAVKKDGMMAGYDIDLIKRVSEAVKIPVVALGGAGCLQHMQAAYKQGYANGLAAGSMFVYQGLNRGVLLNYPQTKNLT
jgi:imidazole glycerol-phosphate synthase subunit HisF